MTFSDCLDCLTISRNASVPKYVKLASYQYIFHASFPRLSVDTSQHYLVWGAHYISASHHITHHTYLCNTLPGLGTTERRVMTPHWTRARASTGRQSSSWAATSSAGAGRSQQSSPASSRYRPDHAGCSHNIALCRASQNIY